MHRPEYAQTDVIPGIAGTTVRSSTSETRSTTPANAANGVDGVHRVDADHETGSVEVTAEAGTEDTVCDSIHDAGYDIAA